MPEFPVTVFHNPACGTSRNVLAMIRDAGFEPDVIEYLKAGWTREQLADLLARMGVSAREILRDKGSPAAELGLLDPSATDQEILGQMVQHPILVNRPIVVSPRGAVLARPAERVFEILEPRPE